MRSSFAWIPLAVADSTCLLGGKYTKDDFKDYEKSMENRSKLAFKDQARSQQEYPSVLLAIHLNAPPKTPKMFRLKGELQQMDLQLMFFCKEPGLDALVPPYNEA